jgi:hypothetical protein
VQHIEDGSSNDEASPPDDVAMPECSSSPFFATMATTTSLTAEPVSVAPAPSSVDILDGLVPFYNRDLTAFRAAVRAVVMAEPVANRHLPRREKPSAAPDMVDFLCINDDDFISPPLSSISKESESDGNDGEIFAASNAIVRRKRQPSSLVRSSKLMAPKTAHDSRDASNSEDDLLSI